MTMMETPRGRVVEGPLIVTKDGVDQFSASDAGVVAGAGALALDATQGFLYVPTCAGTPTGVPVAHAGLVPIVFDTTGLKLWAYTGGAWKGVVVA